MPVMEASWTDEQVLATIGERLRSERLDQNLTIDEVASRSGVSERTIRGVEDGRPFTVATLLALLRVYGAVSRLDALLPERGPSPIDLADRKGQPRQRASRRTSDESEWEW